VVAPFRKTPYSKLRFSIPNQKPYDNVEANPLANLANGLAGFHEAEPFRYLMCDREGPKARLAVAIAKSGMAT
jgi:hypothetical protein